MTGFWLHCDCSMFFGHDGDLERVLSHDCPGLRTKGQASLSRVGFHVAAISAIFMKSLLLGSYHLGICFCGPQNFARSQPEKHNLLQGGLLKAPTYSGSCLHCIAQPTPQVF